MMTMIQSRLVFKHMVELPHCECVFCSTQEEFTGRTRIFLLFKERRKVYQRNGTRGNWEEVLDEQDRQNVWEGFELAVMERKIPSFVAASPEFAAL
ncbi:MAG: hypothetical protein HQL20_08005 [Candidatus Omnitrophica bacterium]|nr:hypothetical protein [Candidatus Omnitrophota bacterium]